jgi:CheY-like chemotaxis protein
MPARSHQPRYAQLFEEIRGRIESGRYPIGQRLPSQQQLAQEFGVAFMTIRRTVEELARAGYVTVRHGAGTFAASPGGPSVLIVDDEPGVRSVIRMILEGEGWTVAEAAEGREALQRLQGTNISYLVTDLRMPNGMDGEELIREVRRLRPEVMILVVTSYAEDLVDLYKLDAWPLTVLRKPIRAEALRRAFQSLPASASRL